MAKSDGDTSVAAEGDLKTTESYLNLRLLGSPGSADAALFVLDQTFSTVKKRAMNPDATGKLPSTWTKLALSGGYIKLTVPLESPSSDKHSSFYFQSRSPTDGRPRGLRRLHNSASPVLRLSDVGNVSTLVVLSDRNDSANEATLLHV